MNEELQREIINILRAMKDGSPQAFQTLVDQRSAYCWGMFIIGVLLLIFGISLFKFGKWACTKLSLTSKDEEGPLVFIVIMSSIGCLSCFGYGLNYILYLPEALAPLGKILGLIK